MSLQPVFIANLEAGLETNVKPFLLQDKAWQMLNNAYCWRGRIKKREGITLVGRLSRVPTITSFSRALVAPGPNMINLINRLVLEETAEITPGNITPLIITYTGGLGTQTLTDTTGTGVLAVSPAGNITAAYINYATGILTLYFTNSDTGTITFSGEYYPGLPVMGILSRIQSGINQDQTIFFDTFYAYIWNGTSFQEFIPGTTWDSENYNFFWGANYRGVTPDVRLFFVTNFQNDALDFMYYTNGATWTQFSPGIAGATPTSADTTYLWSAEILIPYYGRLVALNTWEGSTQTGAINIFNRARFSQIGDPTQVTVVGPPFVGGAWRSDVFGKGGFVDAPTNEQIISAIFYKNTLIVGFENSTWQLRYVGEYGLPFIWERISSDFGMESTFASVLFDDGVLAVGDRAITQSSSNQVQRIDLQNPDEIFGFSNLNQGPERVQSVRDYQKELIYWTLPSIRSSMADTIQYQFPDTLLVYNYRNNTYAKFRENVTALGTFQTASRGITWDSTVTTWDDEIAWDDITNQSSFPDICLGNQQGFIHTLNDGVLPDPSLSITAVIITTGPPSKVQLTINNHNLVIDEFIYLTGLSFLNASNVPVTSNLNNSIFAVNAVIDANNIIIEQWDGFSYATNFVVTPIAATYIGNGRATLVWELLIQTKDFNPFQTQGKQLFLSYIDFQTDSTNTAIFAVTLNMNSSTATQGNLLIGNTQIETFTNQVFQPGITGATQANPCVITAIGSNIETGTQVFITGVGGMTQLNNNTFIVTYIDGDHFSLNGINSTAYGAYTGGGNWIPASARFYTPGSQYAWHRFYATATGQYMSLELGYNDSLMNNIATHNQTWELNAMSLYMRPGGRLNL